jgi:hypothetical protein
MLLTECGPFDPAFPDFFPDFFLIGFVYPEHSRSPPQGLLMSIPPFVFSVDVPKRIFIFRIEGRKYM